MKYSVEVSVKDMATSTEKGKILEDLTAQILRVQQYEVVQTIHVTGMEIDVLAKHKVSNTQILVECKAWDTNLPAHVISQLLGNVMIRNASEGWLISTGALSKDAEGIRNEWEAKTDSERSRLSFYTADRIIQLLLDTNFIVDVNFIIDKIKTNFNIGNSSILMISDLGMHWLIPIFSSSTDFATSILVFDAKTGDRIVDKDFINELKMRKSSYSELHWLSGNVSDNKIVEQLIEEYNNIVPVISGDDWKDYRPARPEDFVGRRNLLEEIYKYFGNVINNTTEMRLFSIKAPSGMGKSSIVLKISSIARTRNKSNKYFVHAVDVRTAISSRYVEMALKSCFDKADKEGFTDVRHRNFDFANIAQFMQSESVANTLEYLKTQNKLIILIFDQFEELFSKKALWACLIT